MSKRQGALGFIGFCVLASVLFGWAHDLVTAHVAVEYFTVYHAKLVESQSPIVMALLWGVLATFWVGGIAGFSLALANTGGPWPILEWGRLRRAVVLLLIVCWVLAMSALVAVYLMAGQIPLSQRRPTFELDRRLVAVAVTHGVSYTSTAVGASVLVIWTVLKRREDSART